MQKFKKFVLPSKSCSPFFSSGLIVEPVPYLPKMIFGKLKTKVTNYFSTETIKSLYTDFEQNHFLKDCLNTGNLISKTGLERKKVDLASLVSRDLYDYIKLCDENNCVEPFTLPHSFTSSKLVNINKYSSYNDQGIKEMTWYQLGVVLSAPRKDKEDLDVYMVFEKREIDGLPQIPWKIAHILNIN